MPQNVFTKPLDLSPKASPQIWMMVVIPHLLALILILITMFKSCLIIATLSLVIILSLFYFLRLFIFKNLKRSVRSIHQDSVNNWYVVAADDRQQSALLLPSSFVSKLLIMLNYAGINNFKYSLLVTPDCVSEDEFRRLRVRLKQTLNN